MAMDMKRSIGMNSTPPNVLCRCCKDTGNSTSVTATFCSLQTISRQCCENVLEGFVTRENDAAPNSKANAPTEICLKLLLSQPVVTVIFGVNYAAGILWGISPCLRRSGPSLSWSIGVGRSSRGEGLFFCVKNSIYRHNTWSSNIIWYTLLCKKQTIFW